MGGPVETAIAGRTFADRLMTDMATITRVASRVFDEATSTYTDTLTTIYAGKCRVKYSATADLVVDAGERAASVREYIVSVPMSVSTVEVGDAVTITASGLDPAQTGLVLHVLGVIHGSQVTARRLRCQEVTS